MRFGMLSIINFIKFIHLSVNVHRITRSPVETGRAPSVVCKILNINILNYDFIYRFIFEFNRIMIHSHVF
jgi:hypothetical protein